MNAAGTHAATLACGHKGSRMRTPHAPCLGRARALVGSQKPPARPPLRARAKSPWPTDQSVRFQGRTYRRPIQGFAEHRRGPAGAGADRPRGLPMSPARGMGRESRSGGSAGPVPREAPYPTRDSQMSRMHWLTPVLWRTASRSGPCPQPLLRAPAGLGLRGGRTARVCGRYRTSAARLGCRGLQGASQSMPALVTPGGSEARAGSADGHSDVFVAGARGGRRSTSSGRRTSARR